MTNYLEISISIHRNIMNCGTPEKEVKRTWNLFYHSMPSDSEESDDEESIMFDSEDELDTNFGPTRMNTFIKNAPVGLWIMHVAPNRDNEAPNKGKKTLYFNSTDAQFEDTIQPKVPELVRFCDEPRVQLYEQLNEYEADVFDFRLCQFDKMRREQCRLNGVSYLDIDTDDEDDTIEFLSREEAAKKSVGAIADTDPGRSLGEICVVQYFVETVEVLKTCLKKKISYPCDVKHSMGETNAKHNQISPESNMNHVEHSNVTNINHGFNQQVMSSLTEDGCESNMKSEHSFKIDMNRAENLSEPNIHPITDPRLPSADNGSACAKCVGNKYFETPITISGPSSANGQKGIQCTTRQKRQVTKSGCLARLMCICVPDSKQLDSHSALCEQSVCS